MSTTESGPLNNIFRSVIDVGEKIWKSIFPSTNIDDNAVDEERITAISHRVPATAWGRELMTQCWPQQYDSSLTSETYLGCVAALLTLSPHLRSGMSLRDIEQKINAIDDSLKKSKVFLEGSHRAGGAVLTVTNMWERTQTGLSADQLVIAYDSELIYAARMFVEARKREKAGETLN